MPYIPLRRSTLRNRGFALMLLLLVLGASAGAALFGFLNSNSLNLERDQRTADALGRAKAALISYAVSSARPGEFPCPDTHNPDTALYGTQNGACGGAGVALGRVPWKSLGIPEPRDGSGETLWYAVATAFRANPVTTIINSDTRGSLTVFAADGATPLTTEAVAVIFAPGAAMAGQTRGGADRNVAANYLEASNGITNADSVAPTGPFVAGRLRDPQNPAYNDRLLYVTTREFMPAVEMRVAAELKKILQAYYDAHGYYPFASKHDDPTGHCAMGVRRGRIPFVINDPLKLPTLPNLPCSTLADWTGSLPSWFANNQWYKVIYYSVAAGYVKDGLGCVGGCLTVGASANVPALFFMPGTPEGVVVRPSNNLSHYLDDAANQHGWGALAVDTYVTPTATALDRDRIGTLTAANVVLTCAQSAAALLALSPCGPPPRLKPQCIALAASLAVCGCAPAAKIMVNVPCMNTFNPKTCQTAVAQLKAC